VCCVSCHLVVMLRVNESSKGAAAAAAPATASRTGEEQKQPRRDSDADSILDEEALFEEIKNKLIELEKGFAGVGITNTPSSSDASSVAPSSRSSSLMAPSTSSQANKAAAASGASSSPAQAPLSNVLLGPSATASWRVLTEGYLKKRRSLGSDLYWFVLRQDPVTLEANLECYEGRCFRKSLRVTAGRVVAGRSDITITTLTKTWRLSADNSAELVAWTVALQTAADASQRVLERLRAQFSEIGREEAKACVDVIKLTR
jgi:hypothetical protein